MEHFFKFLILNISSMKELLHKPSDIQKKIAGTLPGKIKIKIYWAFSCKILPPEITKMLKVAIFWVLWGLGNQCGIPWFFMIL